MIWKKHLCRQRGALAKQWQWLASGDRAWKEIGSQGRKGSYREGREQQTVIESAAACWGGGLLVWGEIWVMSPKECLIDYLWKEMGNSEIWNMHLSPWAILSKRFIVRRTIFNLFSWRDYEGKTFTCATSPPAWADRPAGQTCQSGFLDLPGSGSAAAPRRSSRPRPVRRAAGTSRASRWRSPAAESFYTHGGHLVNKHDERN